MSSLSILNLFKEFPLLVTDFLYDNNAFNFLSSNKQFRQEYSHRYKCKNYYSFSSTDSIPKQVYKLEWKENLPLPNIPSRITHLCLGYPFNQPINNLPSSITHLTLCAGFDQPIDNLPQSITHLEIGYLFNQRVDNLPKSLTYLIFAPHSYFNQPVNNLPHSITHLAFGHSFNQPVDNLPQSLTHLELGYAFNHRLTHLPPSLVHLTISPQSKASLRGVSRQVVISHDYP